MKVERRTRVYPARFSLGNHLSRVLLILTGLVILSGLLKGKVDGDVFIHALPSATPVPLEEAFDETMTEMEITLPSSTWHALQLGAFENKVSAEETAQKYAKRGAAGYVWNDGRYRALAAVYPDKTEAQQVRQQLETQHAVDTYLYAIELPELRLKIKGMQGQLEILQAAFLHAADLINSLQQLGVTMDRREINLQEVQQKLYTFAQQISLVSLRLKQRFTVPRPAVVDEMINLFDSSAASFETFDPQESAVLMTAKIKYETFSALNAFQKIYDELSHT